MKRLSIFFLAFLTFWMSTWMVTDIHDVSIHDADQHHSTLSAAQDHSMTVSLPAIDNHQHHCGVCSYDHGGHMGKTLATFLVVDESIPAQNGHPPHLQSDFWYSRNTTPKLRPPIV